MQASVSALITSAKSAIVLFALAGFAAAPESAGPSSGEIRVAGPGERPQLFFACCNRPMEATFHMFADTRVISGLRDLDAGVAVALDDLSSDRALVVRQLNQEGIPVEAWFVVAANQGYYLNAGNASQADARFTAFEQWSRENGLHWGAIGLDIEPDIRMFENIRGHRLHLAPLLAAHFFEYGRVRSARAAYRNLIHRIHAEGYQVQTYQLPLIALDRKAHSTLFERLLGIVDVRGDREVMMIYPNLNPALGTAVVWNLGKDAQSITIGSTASRQNPLSWDEFSQDLIVASHFSRLVGVYDLEGCVELGYLPRLRRMDWSQPVTIGLASMMRVQRFQSVVELAVWLSELLPYIVLLLLVGLVWRVGRVWMRRRTIQNLPSDPHR
jgi:hypothetical protein